MNVEKPKLPSIIAGDGRDFIKTLTNYLSQMSDALNGSSLNSSTTNIAQIKNIVVTEMWRNTGYGQYKNELLINFESSHIADFDHCEVYVKSNNGTALEIGKDLMASDLGNEVPTAITAVYKFYDYAKTAYTLKDVATNVIYYIKLVAVDRFGNKSDIDSADTIEHYVTGKTFQPTKPTDLTVIFNKDGLIWSWIGINDVDLDVYELRIDTRVGMQAGMLGDPTRACISHVVPPSRSGTVYVYAKNKAGCYSDPAIFVYNKVTPVAPTNFSLQSALHSLSVIFDPIPDDCMGANIYINGKCYYTVNNRYEINSPTGIFIISVCYVDVFGEGTSSGEITKGVIPQITSDLIAVKSITADHIDAGAITESKINWRTHLLS